MDEFHTEMGTKWGHDLYVFYTGCVSEISLDFTVAPDILQWI